MLAELTIRMRRWSLRRFPRRRTVTLTQRRIYILPTLAGAGFLLLLLLLLLLAINYQNNLAYGLTFLLFGLFLVSILDTYGNLAGLSVTAVTGHNCFRGEPAGFALQLQAASGREHEQLRLSWERGTALTVDLTEERRRQLELSCPAFERGVLDPGPLKLETRFPLGLFRAWTWIDTGLTALVYPRPEPSGMPVREGGEGQRDAAREWAPGSEEFQGLARYQQGSSPGQIAWKVYARGQGLHIKQFVSPLSEERWLSWEAWPGVDAETRLSRLCFWALELSRKQQAFGLSIPGTQIAPATGQQHRLMVLRALALFGREGI